MNKTPGVRSVNIEDIWVNRDARQRTDLGNLDELKASLSALGLINPIVVTREGELLAGERRYTAAKELGWTHILVNIFEDMDEIQREQLELDENIRRNDLPWRDECLALNRYHQLVSSQEGPSWTFEDTADKLGLSRSYVYERLMIAKEIQAGTELVVKATDFSVARGATQRLTARRKDNEAEKIDALISSISGGGADPSGRSTIQPSPEDETLTGSPCPIIQDTFEHFLETYTGPKFNLVHCDFPYGIGMDQTDQGHVRHSIGEYSDTPEDYQALLGTLASFTDKHVSTSAHMLFWFSMKAYWPTLSFLTDEGWKVNPTPLIWHKSDNTGVLPDPRRMPRQIYETAFLCSRGDRFLVQAKGNVFSAPVTKRFHMSEKSLPMLQHFLSMVCDDTTRFIDPTCGSGNALIAAQRLGAKSVIGVERDSEFHKLACENWKENADG